MLFFFPWRSESFVDHQPYGTLGVIVANVALFIAFTAGLLGTIGDWLLVYGEIDPLQWLKAAFMHAGWVHLIGNMIFLWAFGVIVEGLVGTPRFLILYFAILALEGLADQVLMYGFEPTEQQVAASMEFGGGGRLGAVGSSGVLFGLAATALIWAPRSRLRCLYYYFNRAGNVSLSAMATVGLLIIWELGSALMDTVLRTHFWLSTPWLHLVGAVAGAAIALAFMSLGLVNTHGWDIFSAKSRRRAW